MSVDSLFPLLRGLLRSKTSRPAAITRRQPIVTGSRPVTFALFGVLLALASARTAAQSRPLARPWSLDGGLAFARLPFTETVAVTATVQDAQGFLWFGTQSNLLRWDGYRLRTYARNPDAAGSLPDNYIRSLLVDDSGRLWVGTNSGGLSRYDPQSDGFISVPVGPGGTRDGTIAALISDGHNGLWIGTGHGIDHLNGATTQIDSAAATGPGIAISALLLDHAGTLWAGTRQGLLRRRTGDADFRTYPLPTPRGAAQIVRALHEDKAGRIWIGLDLSGAYILDHGTDIPRQLLESPNGGKPLMESVSAFSDIDESEVWIGTSEGGIVRFDTRTEKLTHEQRDPARGRSLPSDQIDSMFVDRGGTLWIGTRTALIRIDPSQHLIQTFYGSSTGGGLVRGETVSALLGVPDGRVWMGLVGGGVEIADPEVGPVAVIKSGSGYSDTVLPKTQVVAMARWDDGDIFLGTSAGLYRASPDGRLLRRVMVPGRSSTLDVRALLVADGHLWAGGLDGLAELNVSRDGTVALLANWKAEFGDPRIRTLASGGPNSIWIGTSSAVARLDFATGRVTPVRNDPRNPTMLPGGYISSMLTDRKGRLWVGTFGRGIQVEQRRDGNGSPIFRRLTRDDGLPENSIDALVQDLDGNIWASTDGGLARIELDTLKVRGFRPEQGVGVDGFFTGDADKTPAGDILFGGLNGLIVVHPDRLTSPAAAPAIAVTDLRVAGRSVAPSQTLLRAGVNIGAVERSLTVEFAAPDFTDADRRHYSYRLLGFDAKWMETGASRRVASYTNLPPGEYILQLRTAAPGEQWSVPLAVPVHVKPAWYEYGVARVLEALLGLLLVASLVHFRTRILRRRQRELERIVAERTSELKRQQDVLERMAYLDPLTGLPNRRSFNDDLRRLIAGSARGHGNIVLLMVDLDGFKHINDSLGHDAGDKVLAEVAARLRSLTRATDLVSRLGGDEFGIILAQPRDADAVDATCARIIEKLSEPIRIVDQSVVTGASIGVAPCAGYPITPQELCKVADMALYEAKRAGRNTWRWAATIWRSRAVANVRSDEPAATARTPPRSGSDG